MQLLGPMVPRDPAESHRASTPLELFFDLTFVVAVAQAADGLGQGLAAGSVHRVLIGFPLVFFAIWWAWMNFTWFASAYDTDDAAYRLAVLVLMAGVLILAAGIPRALERMDYGVMVTGYVVMRLAMDSLWLRAAISDPSTRRCSVRYLIGITVLQVGWVSWLFLPDSLALPAFVVLAVLELSVPPWAESVGRTAWHPGHIAERYGLFTIIVLGEALLAVSLGVQSALVAKSTLGSLADVVAGGILTVFAMWWIYFDLPAGEALRQARARFDTRVTGAFGWGYGHYLVFAAVAATGAGLALEVRQVSHRTELSNLAAGFALTVPVAVYLVTVWALHFRFKAPGAFRDLAPPVAAGLVLASSATPQPALATGLVLALLVAVGVLAGRDRPAGRPG